jgi:hypothetical protein
LADGFEEGLFLSGKLLPGFERERDAQAGNAFWGFKERGGAVYACKDPLVSSADDVALKEEIAHGLGEVWGWGADRPPPLL